MKSAVRDANMSAADWEGAGGCEPLRGRGGRGMRGSRGNIVEGGL